LATSMYSEDYDGRFPFGADASDLNTGGWDGTPYAGIVSYMDPIQDVLEPYVSSHLVWRCPSDTGYTAAMTTKLTPIPLPAKPTAYQAYGLSYTYDTWLAILPASIATVSATDGHGVVHGSSDITLFFDTVGTWHGGGVLGEDRYNVVFVDGHAKDLDTDQTRMYLQLTIPPH